MYVRYVNMYVNLLLLVLFVFVFILEILYL